MVGYGDKFYFGGMVLVILKEKKCSRNWSKLSEKFNKNTPTNALKFAPHSKSYAHERAQKITQQNPRNQQPIESDKRLIAHKKIW
jgi:hypothetical protein